MQTAIKTWAVLGMLACTVASAELQNTVSISAPALYPGEQGSFTVDSVPPDVPTTTNIGTKTYTYPGLMRYVLGRGEGRFAAAMGFQRYGVPFDTFEVFQSLVSPLFPHYNIFWNFLSGRSDDLLLGWYSFSK